MNIIQDFKRDKQELIDSDRCLMFYQHLFHPFKALIKVHWNRNVLTSTFRLINSSI